MRKLIASNEGTESPVQHTRPCTDCPFRRDSLKGWLGGSTPMAFVAAAQGDGRMDCHVIVNRECAGAAIFRSNICKRPRDPYVLRLPANRDDVFSSPVEFQAHHTSKFKGKRA